MKNYILDTDLGGDCDDATAIALLNKFYNNKRINILGMMYSNSNEKGAKLVKEINKYYHNDFRVGLLKDNELQIDYYIDIASKALDILNVKTSKDEFENANDMLYEILTNSCEKGANIICVGQLRNIANFLNSSFNGLSGADIFNKKVECLYIMGGYFNQKDDYFMVGDLKLYGEYNIVTDLESAKTVINKVKTEMVFSDFEVGLNILTFSKLSTNYDSKNPVSIAYKVFENGPRHSWDPLTVLYSLVGDNEYFMTKRGSINLSEKGRTFFTIDDNSNIRIVILRKTKEETAKYLESFFSDELWLFKIYSFFDILKGLNQPLF